MYYIKKNNCRDRDIDITHNDTGQLLSGLTHLLAEAKKIIKCYGKRENHFTRAKAEKRSFVYST